MSAKLVPHPCVDAASFCSFVLLQKFGFVFGNLVFGNTPINPVRGSAWSLDKLHRTYPVRLHGMEIMQAS
jgi:hypothetical protein